MPDQHCGDHHLQVRRAAQPDRSHPGTTRERLALALFGAAEPDTIGRPATASSVVGHASGAEDSRLRMPSAVCENRSLRRFDPFFKNPHLATLAGNYWRRPTGERRWPVRADRYQTEPGIEILVHSQRPDAEPRGELVTVHGLEGSSESGYARSMSYAALEAGFATHREFEKLRRTEALALSNYHSEPNERCSVRLAGAEARGRAADLPRGIFAGRKRFPQARWRVGRIGPRVVGGRVRRFPAD